MWVAGDVRAPNIGRGSRVASAAPTWYQRGMSTLDEPTIRAALADLDGWQIDGDAIVRELRFDGFLDAIASSTASRRWQRPPFTTRS